MLLSTLRFSLSQSCYDTIDSSFVNSLKVAHMQYHELFRFTKLMTQSISKSMFVNYEMYARDNTSTYRCSFATSSFSFKVISLWLHNEIRTHTIELRRFIYLLSSNTSLLESFLDIWMLLLCVHEWTTHTIKLRILTTSKAFWCSQVTLT